MRTTLLGIAVAAALTCAGCASASAPQPSDPGATVIPAIPAASQHSGSTAAQNRVKTRAEAARLLKLAPLPPGATSVKGPQPDLTGPSLGTPSTSSLMDLPRFWKSSMSLAAAYKYEKSHAPAGLTLAGTGSSGSVSGGLTSEGIGWGETNRSYAVGLELDIGIAPVAGGTIIRADGLGEWIDPRPVRDTQPGKRLRVTVAGGCPTSDRGVVGVRSPGRSLDAALLPSGAPTSVLICEFGGLNPPDVLRLYAHALLSARDAAAIAQQVLALPLGHTDGGETSCPAGTGVFVALAFHYPGRADVDLGFAQSGCETVSNGHIIVADGLKLTRYIKAPPAL